MIEPQPLSAATIAMLDDAGLDAGAVGRLIAVALDEDLADGVDVTSVATIPLDLVSTATFGARARGVIAGLPVAAAVIEMVCGAAASDFEHARRRRHGGRAGNRDRASDGADPAAPHRRTHRAQPAVSPVGRGDAHAPLGRSARGNRRPGARHAQDDAGPAGAREVRRALRRRREPSHGSLRHGAREGQPRRRGRWRRRGVPPREGPGVDDPGRDRGRLARRTARRRSRPVPTRC